MRSVNREPQVKKPEVKRAGVTATAGLLAVLALAGCAPSNSEATEPTKAPSSHSGEATPPTVEPTKSPEAPNSAEHKFSGTIDLATFTGEGWTSLSEADQYLKCDALFDANIENRVQLTPESTGPEIAQGFKDKLLVLQDLVSDKSDDRYYEAAQNIATCVSANLITNDGGNDGLDQILEDLKTIRTSSIDGMTMTFIEPENVTRYSDGTFPGQTDANDTYAAFAVEGRTNAKYNDTLQVEYFKWVPDVEDYDFVLRTPLVDASVVPNFGSKPPVEVQQ